MCYISCKCRWSRGHTTLDRSVCVWSATFWTAEGKVFVGTGRTQKNIKRKREKDRKEWRRKEGWTRREIKVVCLLLASEQCSTWEPGASQSRQQPIDPNIASGSMVHNTHAHTHTQTHRKDHTTPHPNSCICITQIFQSIPHSSKCNHILISSVHSKSFFFINY